MASVTQWLAGAAKTFGGQYQWDQQQRGTNGAAHIKAPTDIYGTIGHGDQDLNGVTLAANVITLNSGSGFTGIRISTAIDSTAIDLVASLFVAVGANNTAFNDITIAGLRHVIPLGETDTIPFVGTPLPTQITIGVDTDVAAVNLAWISYTTTEA